MEKLVPLALGVISSTRLSTVTLFTPFWEMMSACFHQQRKQPWWCHFMDKLAHLYSVLSTYLSIRTPSTSASGVLLICSKEFVWVWVCASRSKSCSSPFSLAGFFQFLIYLCPRLILPLLSFWMEPEKKWAVGNGQVLHIKGERTPPFYSEWEGLN